MYKFSLRVDISDTFVGWSSVTASEGFDILLR